MSTTYLTGATPLLGTPNPAQAQAMPPQPAPIGYAWQPGQGFVDYTRGGQIIPTEPFTYLSPYQPDQTDGTNALLQRHLQRIGNIADEQLAQSASRFVHMGPRVPPPRGVIMREVYGGPVVDPIVRTGARVVVAASNAWTNLWDHGTYSDEHDAGSQMVVPNRAGGAGTRWLQVSTLDAPSQPVNLATSTTSTYS
jgi:hypothetical protein